ncbi:hypothetical protein C9374_006844 [Naegleria lovaniensis]|uniref:Uncharacterized protein n=1 Tax=Naegleria lovaniensis TaxID=51637 RepID=A0AA88H2D7_NAELO|nr:uncharacterized protein C9374_006844 [Naegleria lovaniensis]KAG2393313.1 hypothetical protein C9374_006844 [Naegleria lovaniensis]
MQQQFLVSSNTPSSSLQEEQSEKSKLVFTALNGQVLLELISTSCSGVSPLLAGYECGRYIWEYKIHDPLHRDIDASIEIGSNMNLDRVAPMAVEIHRVSITFKRNHQVVFSFHSNNYDDCPVMKIPSGQSPQKTTCHPNVAVQEILRWVGLDQFMVSPIAAWNCLMTFLRVLQYFRYEKLVKRVSDISERLQKKLGMNSTLKNGLYECKFIKKGTSIKDVLKHCDLNSLKVFKSSSIQCLKSRPFKLIFEYNGHKLEYREKMKNENKNRDSTTFDERKNMNFNNQPFIHISELLFDEDVIFSCEFPSKTTMAEFPCYVPGMVVVTDNRHPDDACVNFAHTILKSAFALEQDEEHWIALISTQGFHAFELVFSRFRKHRSIFFDACFAKLAKEKPSALSDIEIKCQN